MSTDPSNDYIDPIDNPAALEQALQVVSDSPSAIPTIPDLPDTYKRLPGGLFVGDRAAREVEVKELNGEDEERIARAKNSSEPNTFIKTILRCGIASLGDLNIEKNMGNLLVGDTDFILLAIREATYGSEIELGETRCPNCGTDVEVTVDVSDIPVHRLGDESEREFVLDLRKGGKARVRLSTVDDQTAYLEKPNLTVAERNSILLSRCVLTITDEDGEEESVAAYPSLVQELGVADRRKILDEIANRMPGPRYDEVNVEHDCGFKIAAPIGLVSLFPGL